MAEAVKDTTIALPKRYELFLSKHKANIDKAIASTPDPEAKAQLLSIWKRDSTNTVDGTFFKEKAKSKKRRKWFGSK